MCEIYNTQILDDFHHLTHIHGENIRDTKHFTSQGCKENNCNLDECKFADRHYRINTENTLRLLLIYRLFMGSRYSLLISIMLMEISLNSEKVMSAITALNILVSSEKRDTPSTYKHSKIMSSLFNYILNDKLDRKFNQYIYRAIQVFTSYKQKIYINLNALDAYNMKDDRQFKSLIVNELKTYDEAYEEGKYFDMTIF